MSQSQATLFGDDRPAVLVSQCWRGDPCRYHGAPKPRRALLERLSRRYQLIFVCPELLGGLPVPRPAAPLCRKMGGQLTDVTGRDVTIPYAIGAAKVVALARRHGCQRAYLVAGSPACDRNGFAGELLTRNGVHVINY